MDSSPTSLFDSYEQDFQQILQSIRDKLEGDGSDQRGEQKKAALRRVEMELDEADEMVSQMEIEIQGIPQSIRPQYQSRIRAVQGRPRALQEALPRDARPGLARRTSSPPAAAPRRPTKPYGSSDRARLLAGTTVLEDGSRRLQESQRIALETEEQGADILRSLMGQREQIENARNTLQTADNSIDRASGTLKKMIRRMYQQRVVTAIIILVLVLLIGIIIWEKLR
ncbi:vesicle transport v-snare protein vti1 [Lactarius vividus]|nr:vesicle transport v-snare protein vti1 [Lactarius vividus]